jgi:hypothetical protein
LLWGPLEVTGTCTRGRLRGPHFDFASFNQEGVW